MYHSTSACVVFTAEFKWQKLIIKCSEGSHCHCKLGSHFPSLQWGINPEIHPYCAEALQALNTFNFSHIFIYFCLRNQGTMLAELNATFILVCIVTSEDRDDPQYLTWGPFSCESPKKHAWIVLCSVNSKELPVFVSSQIGAIQTRGEKKRIKFDWKEPCHL